jgi:hypothetical protein
MTQDIAKALVGGLIGLFSTLLTKWAAELGEAHRIEARLKRIDEATKHVAFWELWLRTQSVVRSAEEMCDLKAMAQKELDGASQLVVAVHHEMQPENTQHRVSPSALRRAVLLYAPARQRAWIPRVFFYFSTLYFIGIVVSSVILMASTPGFGFTDILQELIIVIIVGAFAWLFRLLSMRFDDPRTAF